MSDLSQRFQSFLIKSGLIAPGDRVLVAVSGGADSIALLFLLYEAAARFPLYLEAAHLDHGLRPESVRDAEFVANLCARLGIRLTAEQRDVAGKALQLKGNLEEVGRLERRDFLRATARERQCSRIALGHHRGDQAETFLLRLLRGSGPAGLAGMQPVAEEFVRPLLAFCRGDIIDYLRASGREWREDASNADRTLTRNRIRHELMPLLREFNPNIENRLTDLCSLFAEDEAFWDETVRQMITGHGREGRHDVVLPLQLLLDAPPALAGRLVRAALRHVRGDLRRIARVHIAGVLELVRGGAPQAEIDLPGCRVARRYEQLRFSAEPCGPPPVFDPVVIDGPGSCRLPDGRRLLVSVHDEARGEGPLTTEFASDAVSFPLTVRTFQAGDRLCPDGMQGSKKLQDLFVDAKLTRESRARVPLIVCNDEILWVIGMRRCRGYRGQGTSRAVLRLNVVDR